MADVTQRVAVFNTDAPVSNEIKSRNALYNIIWFLVVVAGFAGLALLTYLLGRFAYSIGATNEETVVVFVFALIIAALTAGIPIARTYARRRIPEIEGYDNAAWIICFIVSTAAVASFIYAQHSGANAQKHAAAACNAGEIACLQQTTCWYDRTCLDNKAGDISNSAFTGSRKAPGVEERAQRDLNIIDARVYQLKRRPEQAPESLKPKPAQAEESGWTAREVISLVFAIFASGAMIFLAAFLLWFGSESLIAFSSEGNLSALTPAPAPPPFVTPVAPPAANTFRMWWADCVSVDQAAKGLKYKDIYQSYEDWCVPNGFSGPNMLGKKDFGEALLNYVTTETQGVAKRHSGGTVYDGLRIV